MSEPNLGRPVAPLDPPARIRRSTLRGPSVTLRKPELSDVDALYPATHGSPGREQVWTYMGYGPWDDPKAMAKWIAACAASTDPMFYTVESAAAPVGMVSMLNIDPGMRRLELGHIWYVPGAQRTGVNTEVTRILLGEAFDSFHCRRVEWKCDSLNVPSRHAAVRLGFSYEGTFRNHMIVKGRNRDTAWYAIIEEEWPRVNVVLDSWLGADDPKPSLTAMMADRR